jgi:hypothetical protein
LIALATHRPNYALFGGLATATGAGVLNDPLGHGPFAFIGEPPAFVPARRRPRTLLRRRGTTQPARRRRQLA